MNTKITILYVDDEPINLLLFSQMFDSRYNIITAESGYVGLNLIERNPDICIVISDMKMPGMNGIEFITIAKKQYSNIHFYILTGYDITPEIEDAIESGLISKYFQKPFKMGEIELAISNKLNTEQIS
ncbi:MAG TPA: response regulator [Tenuifilaceae bacterium]|nr:response regulator [Tenuifilaceae bacterium]